ncbi:Ankyrin repeats (3 copies) [Rubripirellula tenax]|uniref:Ankyrin repeats (3 copies) n=1 Tax=Rubripirellula tenax TaxID=2528015 RepID=A0A5C6FJ61_9BACT|nr:ankyrin repeat domain-containing protein [Rubripirellula tenax]TWU59732.1 Ankyrin repeats (3 copies) [Rubripirellula tenax]
MTRDIDDPPTRLLVALTQGDRDAALAAIYTGDDINARDHRPIIGDQTTALHLAALDGDQLLIRELIRHGADVDAQCGTGQTPLWFACNGGHYEAIKELLASGADYTITNNDGYTPRDRIAASDPRIIAMLDDHVARKGR